MIAEIAEIRHEAILVNIEKLKLYPEFLQNQFLLAVIDKISPGRKDICSEHIQGIMNLLSYSISHSTESIISTVWKQYWIEVGYLGMSARTFKNSFIIQNWILYLLQLDSNNWRNFQWTNLKSPLNGAVSGFYLYTICCTALGFTWLSMRNTTSKCLHDFCPC